MGETTKNFLNDGRSKGKLLRMYKNAQKAATFIKSLKTVTPEGMAKFIDIVNDAVQVTQSGVCGVHQGIPSIKDKGFRNNFLELTKKVSEVAHELQCHLHAGATNLQVLLSNSFNKIADLSGKISDLLQNSDCGSEAFLSNQIRRAIHEAIFLIVKLKYEIEFFSKTNQQLECEIDTGLDPFSKTLKNVTDDNQKIREELIFSVQHFRQVLDRAVFKLENFVHVNSGSEETITTVKKVSKEMSESSNALHQLSSENPETALLKIEIEKVYKTVTNLVKKLAQVEVSAEVPGGFFIRGILFDSIAASNIYECEIRNCQNEV